MKTMNITIINSVMGNVVKYICVVILLIGTSVSAWGFSVPISHSTLVGATQAAGNPTSIASDATSVTLQYNISAGYDPSYPSISWTTRYSSNMAYGYNWEYVSDGVYSLTLYSSSGKWYTGGEGSAYISISLSLENCTSPSATVSPTSKTVNYGSGTFTLSASRTGGGAVTWSTSNSSVATVSGNATSATVTPVGAGTATITYSVAKNDDYCAEEATCEVTVNAIAPTLSHNVSGKELTVSNITSTGARISGGVVTNKGGANITQYGFVVGTANTVTYGSGYTKRPYFSSNIAENTAFGAKDITDLTPNTTYYVKATAYNGSQRGHSSYISFTTLQRYTISYNNNLGGGAISNQYKDHGATATLNSGTNFSKTGYTLSKWHTNADGTSGTDYALSGSYTANANVTMYAVWTPNPYTITLNNQGADTGHEGTASISVTYDANTNLTSSIIVPTRTGYTFGGYYTESNGGGVQIIAADGSVNAGVMDDEEIYTSETKQWFYANDITLYAKWTAKTISLVLDKNNSDVSSTTSGSATVKFGNSALEDGTTHATRGGDYNLVGYYAETGTTTKVLESNGTFAAENVTGYITSGKWSRETTPTTLFAKWSLATYTVTFNMHGHGSAVASQVVESGESASEPEEPVAEDWHFLGWYTDDGAGNATNTEFNFSTSITGNTTIHAKWEAVTYSTTLKAWCDPDIDITGDIHLTSVNGVYVNSTAATNNLLRITSDDLAGATKLDIKYLDADNADAEVAPASSLFRLCNDGVSPTNYNTADGTQIDVSAANTCDLSYSIRYTPNEYDVINHYKLQITMKRGTRAVKTVTKDLYGRSLPEEFVLAVKDNDNYWYALPNTIVDNSNAIKPIKISVDNTTTPTKAVCASTDVVYNGDGRYAAGTNVYGVRFTDGVLKDAKYDHLQVSTTSGDNHMWLSYTGSSTCQDWMLTTSDFGAYTLKLPTSGNATKQMGIKGHNIGYYDSPDAGNVYILPIDTKITENEALVTEWGKKSVILDVDAQTASSAQAHFGDRAEAEKVAAFAQTRTSVANSTSIYNYTLRFGTLDFSEHKDEILYIDWLDAEDGVLSTSTITIPWIIATDGKMTAISTDKDAWAAAEVHVLPGVTLEANGGDFDYKTVAIKQLEIYPGATVTITKGDKDKGALNPTTLVLRNGWTRAGSKEYDVARLYITDNGTLTKPTNTYLDWYIDFDQYYPIAVPWKVTTAGITYLNTSNAASSSVIKLRYYDGAGRVTGANGSAAVGANWVELNPWPETLDPSKGYAMTARRPTGKAFSIVRMPLTIPSAAWTTGGEKGSVTVGAVTTHKDQVEVTAHGADDPSKPEYVKGWNFIANPYMALHQGELSYTDAGTIEYANIPDVTFKEYDQVPIATTKLKPASGFLVQAPKTGTVTFGETNRKAAAPSYRTEAADETPVQRAYITLANEEAEDMMGILVADKYTEAYEMNADLEKLLSDGNTLRTYMRYGDMNMAYVAINETLAKEWIPVSVRIPADGEYTFSLHEASIAGELEGVYLIDYQNGDKITNLIEQSYTFSSTAGTINGRFAINAKVGERQTPTGIDAINAGGDINSDKPFKFIYHDKVYIWLNGVIYDTTGKRVK